MLVLSRKLNEEIFIGDGITIRICTIDRGKVRLGIVAPKGVEIIRADLMTRQQQQERAERNAKGSR